MSDPDLRPGDDGELPTLPEAPKSSIDSQPDTPRDWYGQTSKKRKNDGRGASENTGTRALIIAAALFVMAFILVVAAALLIRLSSAPQVIILAPTQAPATQVVLIATIAPSPTIPSVTPMPLSPTPRPPPSLVFTSPSWTPAPPLNFATQTMQAILRLATTMAATPHISPIPVSPSPRPPVASPTPRPPLPTPAVTLTFPPLPQITFYPAFTPVGTIAALTPQPSVTPVAVLPSPTFGLVPDILTPSLPTFTPAPFTIHATPSLLWTANTLPAPNDCASFTADPSLPKIAYETNRDGGWNIYVTSPTPALFCRLTQPGSLTANHAYQPA